MPKSLSEKRTVWSENTLEEHLVNHKRCNQKKNHQKFKKKLANLNPTNNKKNLNKQR